MQVFTVATKIVVAVEKKKYLLSLIESICFNLIHLKIFNDYLENVRLDGKKKIGMPQHGLCIKSKVVPLTVFFLSICILSDFYQHLYFCLVMFFIVCQDDDNYRYGFG